MTEIEKKALALLCQANERHEALKAENAKLREVGIIEGLEMAAPVAEQWDENSPYNSRAAAIRALIEETGQ